MGSPRLVRVKAPWMGILCPLRKRSVGTTRIEEFKNMQEIQPIVRAVLTCVDKREFRIWVSKY